jgi:hypothetical protein
LNDRASLNQDVAAGLFFLAFGVLFVVLGRDLTFGSTLQMGPGYFPFVLGLLLIVLGLGLAAKGYLAGGAALERWSLRPVLLVILSLVLFAVLIGRAGFLVSGAACVGVAALGGREFRLREAAVLIAVAVPLAGLLFIWLLGLPMQVAPSIDWR